MTHPVGKRDHSPAFWIYVFFALMVVGLVAWSSLRLLQETPSREAGAQVPGVGWVSLTLTTEPFPPLSTGTVNLKVLGETERGLSVDLGDELPFEFGLRGDDAVLGRGHLSPTGGVYSGGVQFPAAGNYWLDFIIQDAARVRFQLTVEPQR